MLYRCVRVRYGFELADLYVRGILAFNGLKSYLLHPGVFLHLSSEV